MKANSKDRMSSKAVLPPSRLRRSSPETTVHLLQKKLDVAEKETIGLVHKLSGLGFNGSSRLKNGGGEQRNDSSVRVMHLYIVFIFYIHYTFSLTRPSHLKKDIEGDVHPDIKLVLTTGRS